MNFVFSPMEVAGFHPKMLQPRNISPSIHILSTLLPGQMSSGSDLPKPEIW